MATLCRNCGNPLVYDPITKRVICDACGSAFAAESIEAYSKQFEENRQAQPAQDVVSEFLECHVYSCSSCGGEIIINGSEASTTCIYCGSPSVIFSRISKEKRPDYILPFQVSKDDALKILNQRFSNGLFIPKAFKQLNPEMIRGIYIPYWLVNAYHAESNIISSAMNNGNSSTTYYYARAGYLQMNNMTIEASRQLNDESSRRLEPYDFAKLKPFDEEYMLGFYSNMSDISYGELRQTIDKRSASVYQSKVRFMTPGGIGKILDTKSATLIDKDVKYALLPAWFITVQHEGKPHTILINGENGKVVCGLPWNKKLFWTLICAIGGGVGLLGAIIGFIVGTFINPFGTVGAAMYLPSMLPGFLPWLLIATVFFLIGLVKYKRVTEQIKLTQDVEIFNFTKKRQG